MDEIKNDKKVLTKDEMEDVSGGCYFKSADSIVNSGHYSLKETCEKPNTLKIAPFYKSFSKLHLNKLWTIFNKDNKNYNSEK